MERFEGCGLIRYIGTVRRLHLLETGRERRENWGWNCRTAGWPVLVLFAVVDHGVLRGKGHQNRLGRRGVGREENSALYHKYHQGTGPGLYQ